MSSENAKLVAQEVIKAVGEGRKVNKTKIQENCGYSKTSSHTHKAIETKTYKDEINPFIKKLETERKRIINHIKKRKLTPVDYKKLVDSIDVLTKNIQLLSGKETEKSGIIIETTNYKDEPENKDTS